MNIKYSGLIVWAMGVALIVALCVLLEKSFADSRVLVLDGVVAVVVYSLVLYNFTGWMRPAEEFGSDVPAVGVKMYVTAFYVVLAILGGIIGFFAPIVFKWQLIMQLFFAFLLIVGLMTGFAGNQRLATVTAKSQQNHQATDHLQLLAQQLKMAALGIDNGDVRSAVDKLAERVAFISPSQSPIAHQLEEKLTASMRRVASMLDGDATELLAEIEKAQNILKQRITTY